MSHWKRIIGITVLLLLTTPVIHPVMADSPTEEVGDEIVTEQLPMLPGGTSLEWLPVGGEIAPQTITPWPFYPVSAYVYTKTPTFVFTRNINATNYRIEVFDLYTGSRVYVYKGTGKIYGDYVWLEPDTPLKIFGYNGIKGHYSWHVGAKVGGQWGQYSTSYEFWVGTPGFTSTFNVDSKKWLQLNGSWSVVSPGYLKDKGILNTYTSMMHKYIMSSDFTYETRMKLKPTTASNYGGVIIGGEPGDLGTEGEWEWGYYILFDNYGKATIFARNGSGVNETVFPWTPVPSIVSDDWNEIKVVVSDYETKLSVYFNGQQWTSVTIGSGIRDGYLGLTHFKTTDVNVPVLVDWVMVNQPGYAGMPEE